MKHQQGYDSILTANFYLKRLMINWTIYNPETARNHIDRTIAVLHKAKEETLRN